MRTVPKDVKLKGEVVAQVDVPVYETMEDLTTLDEKKLLGLVNRQLAADIMNAKRGEFRQTVPGKQKKRMEAMNVLAFFTFSDGETGMQKLQACSTLGSPVERTKALEALLDSDELQAEVDKRLGVA